MLLLQFVEVHGVLIDKEDLNEYMFCTAAFKNSKEKYVKVMYKGRQEYLHRLIMGLPDCLVDHKNGNLLDCRRENLRLATHVTNGQNSSSTRSGSGMRGVSWCAETRLWRARIKVGNKQLTLGRFSSKEDAWEAYKKAAKTHFGEFASGNWEEST